MKNFLNSSATGSGCLLSIGAVWPKPLNSTRLPHTNILFILSRLCLKNRGLLLPPNNKTCDEIPLKSTNVPFVSVTSL